jgi:hypothetical protein
MILVWRGWGIVVPVVVFLSALFVQMISTKLAGDGYWEHHSYPLSMALLIAGGLIWLADRFLYRNPGRITVDEKTGERFRWITRHDFFFVRLRWWSLVCLGAAVVVLILK